MDIALQVVAFREPDLSSTLDAWAEQQVPEWASVSYEAWITPDGDPSTCDTFQQAESHSVFSAHEAPKYKLPTRNAAHDSAVERGMDGVVVGDADAPPLDPDTLTNLLTELRAPNTAAAVARPTSRLSKPTGFINTIGVSLKELVGGMHGQTHALTQEAWRHAGPFEEDLDHTSLNSVWKEEEFRFPRRLRQVGHVRYVHGARVYNDTRRRDCTWQRAMPYRETDPWCEREGGTETFRPR